MGGRTTEPARRPPRERLLVAADALFYAEGVQSVGIDRVVRAAGVAKASLYSTFGSKEALVGAYLQRRHEAIVVRLRGAVDDVEEPRERILAVFDAQAEFFSAPGFRGCPFAAASAEALPGGEVDAATRHYRREVRTLLTELAASAGAPEPAALGRRLHLLYDAANTAAHLDRDPGVARDARAVVTVVLDAALGPRTEPGRVVTAPTSPPPP